MAGGSRVLRIVIAGDSKGAERSFDAIAQKTRSLGSQLATLGAGLSFAGIAAKTYDLGKALEQNVNVLQQLSTENGQVTKTAAQFTRELSAQTMQFAKLGYSTGEASGALVELVKAGVPANQSMKSLQATLVLARAGGLELADAATAISNTLNVFGDTGINAAGVANILANAANLSSANVGNLLESLQMSSSVATQANLSFAETAAMLALLANNGIKGSDAGTSMKTMLNRLRVGVEGSKEALKNLNVSVYDSQGNMRKLTDIIADLDEATKPLTEEARAEAFYKIFGSDAIRSGTIATKEGSKSIREFIAAVQQGGQAQAIAESRTKGFSGALMKMGALARSMGEQTYMAFAQKAGPGAAQLAERLQKLMEEFKNGTGLGGRLRETLVKIGGALAALGPALQFVATVVGALLIGLLPVINALADFTKWALGSSDGAFALQVAVAGLGAAFVALKIAGWISAFIKWGGVLKLVRTAVINLRFAMWMLNAAIAANPIGIAVAAAAALVAVFVLLYKRSETFRIGVRALVQFAVAGFQLMGSWALKFASLAIRVFATWFKVVTSGFGAIVNGAAKAFGWIPGLGPKVKAAAAGFNAMRDTIISGLDRAADYADRLGSSLDQAARSRISTIFIQTKKVTGPVQQTSLRAMERAGNMGEYDRKTGPDARVQKQKPSTEQYGTRLPGTGGESFDFSTPKKKKESAAQKAARKARETLARVGESLGKFLARGVLDGVLKNKNVLENASNLVEKLIRKSKASKTQKSAAVRILERDTLRLEALIDKRKSVTAKLKQAEAQLAKLKDLRANMVNKVRDKILESADIAGAFSTEEKADNSTAGILGRFRKMVAAAKAFGGKISSLSKMGLNVATLQQIIDAGPVAGGAIADALIKGGGVAVSEVNMLQKDLTSSATGLGNTVAGTLYDAGIRAAEGLVKGLKSQKAEIEKTMIEIAKSMTTAIRTALGIKSPSRVFMGIGDYTAQGFAKGIEGGSGGVQSAMDKMAALRPAQTPLAGAGAAGVAGGGGIVVNLNVNGHLVASERDLVRTVMDGIRDAQRRAGKKPTI